MTAPKSSDRLLVFDCHEAWVYQLRVLPQPMDVVVGLKGRHTDGWDAAMRPIPPNARIVRLTDVVAASPSYHCIVAHNLSDLLDVKALSGPRLLVIHQTLESIMREQHSVTPPGELRHTVGQYIAMIHAHVVAVSGLKGRSWGFDQDVVPFSADPSDYPAYRGDVPRGLRIANDIRAKANTLMWDFHERAFAGVPVTLLGRNDDMPGVKPARDWNELKEALSHHRFFVHTASPELEDGYNMATLEAMAAGLPVLGNRHPTSPIEHGVSGFLSDDPAELRAYAQRLLEDQQLARRMGQEAQKVLLRMFPVERFRAGFLASIERARRKWLAARPA
jgi:glycosyltransferase involved in cell wall biosynthesis